ncbi:AraC family transcriptional regulator [Streptomyces sp. WAC 06738]|uniref:AraC family transcriptional regulator n=1 Tax=Streptomyces sp. WAC 06738 TaxID=2203210 RepID=UPI000F6BDDEC|nr:AraC family transcriptional regulator [Streptomyces sp. WAC 06738]AZM44600.1 AraC family transcriptional regulator [Streptomyces sp. WAC 06738]
MDVLSDVISALRVGRPGSERVEWYSPWSQRFADQPGTAGFLVVLQGTCWLIEEASPPVRLDPGDLVFSPQGNGYALADSADTFLIGQSKATSVPRHAVGRADGAEPPTRDPGGRPHAVTLCGGYRLAPHPLHPLLRELPATIHIPARPGRHPELRAAVDMLGAELDSRRRPGTDALVAVLLDMLLLCSLRAWFEEHRDTGTAANWGAALADPGLSTALNAIHDNPAHPWTVQELADKARMSRATLSRRFTILIRQSPLAYLTWWRMNLAAQLLETEPSAPLAAVASRVGYTSEFAFATAFKRHFDLSPGRYRRRATAPPHEQPGPPGQ